MASSLQKNETILEVIKELFDKFGEDNFQLTDYWEDDLYAVGIKNVTDRKHLIYISTFNRPIGFYFVEVEKSNSETDLADYSVVKKFEKAGFDQILELFRKYLYLKPL